MYKPDVIQALKEALRNVFWYKDDLRLFLIGQDLPPGLVSKQAWHDNQEYKIKIASKILDELIALGDEGLGPMRRLINAVLTIDNFDHLRRLEDGPEKVQNARRSVEALREVVGKADASFLKTKADRDEKATRVDDALSRRNEEMASFQTRFYELAAEPDPQKRGYLFEKFLLDVFAAHDMDPRGSFRITGEQIDGAFEFEGTQFLLEAKWVAERVSIGPLDAFAGKVDRRLENTLGVFMALNGFSDDALEAFRARRPSVILWDGEDLAIVLQGLMDFRALFKRKVRHAAQTGNSFLRARDVGAI